jgi:hypothetical protein
MIFSQLIDHPQHLLLKCVMAEIERLYAASDLPDTPDPTHAEALLVQIRKRFY